MRAGVLTGVLLAALGAWSLAAQQPATLTLPVGGGAVATGDLNGDGSTDIATSAPGAVAVTTNHEGSSFSVACSRGRTGLTEAAVIAIPESPFAVAIGDVTGDRVPDLAIAHRSGSSANSARDRLTVLIGVGDCTFRSNPESTASVANIASNDVATPAAAISLFASARTRD